MRVGVLFAQILENLDQEIFTRTEFAQFRNHGAVFGFAAEIRLRLVEFGIRRFKHDSAYTDRIVGFFFGRIHHGTDEHVEEFRQFVLALHRGRNPEHVRRDGFQQGFGELFAADAVDLVDDGEAELGIGGLRERFVVHGLDHGNHNVLVVHVVDLRLDSADAGTRSVFLNALDPLVHEEFFVDEDHGLLFEEGDDFNRHDRFSPPTRNL